MDTGEVNCDAYTAMTDLNTYHRTWEMETIIIPNNHAQHMAISIQTCPLYTRTIEGAII